jgi:hypothetical protein
MFNTSPNPPEADSSSTSAKSKAKQQDETTEPKPEKSQDDLKPGQLYTVVEGLDNECLLANLSETLASADAMVSDLAFDLDGSRRHVALGIQQLIELSSLLANRVLDNVEPGR